MDTATAIRHFCAYQERSHKEVRNKLYELGCSTSQVEETIADLIANDYLNEERFARALARGKFRLKGWGKVKIIQHLKLHRVSDYCIKKGLTEIDQEEYQSTMRKHAEKKMKELKSERNIFIRKAKLQRYLLQKGYESFLVNEIITEIIDRR